MRHLNAQPGDVWSLSDMSGRIARGRTRGLHRVHYHTSCILEQLLRGEVDQAAAYLTQLVRCVHQVSLDNGSWSTAMHMLPRADPLEQPLFGGAQAELEIISSYQEALKKLKQTGGEKGDGKGGAKADGKKTAGGDGLS